VKLIAPVVALLWSAAAHAYTGNELLRICEEEATFNRGACIGYIRGVADGIAQYWAFQEYVRSSANPKAVITKAPFCMPKGVTVGQIEDVAVAHIRNNPSLRHHQAPALIMGALVEAFPCRE
jgi:hypothetical protein